MTSSAGHNLGYYYKLANYLFIIPLVLLLLVAIGYNVLVGFAVKWMYTHAWTKKDQNYSVPPPMDSTMWDEVFVLNSKLVGYLLGGALSLKQKNGYFTLFIHDYEVYMPLAAVFIQVSELATMIIAMVAFVDSLFLQVTHVCESHGVDCFLASETDRNALPLNCSSMDDLEVKLTCFQLTFTPIAAAAVTGGFLKFVPQVIFSGLTLQYIKYLNKIKEKLHFSTTKSNLVVHIVVAFILEVCFIGVGLMALFAAFFVPSIHDITYGTANPVFKLNLSFTFIMYFLMAGFLWCIYPLTYTASVRKTQVPPAEELHSLATDT